MDRNATLADAHQQATTATEAAPAHRSEIEDEVLLEEISIDGMCGVY